MTRHPLTWAAEESAYHFNFSASVNACKFSFAFKFSYILFNSCRCLLAKGFWNDQIWFFVLFLLKFLYVHSLCFQIYTYSQLAPMFVISGKHFANSKVIAEEKQARKYFYPAQASCPQMLHKDNELWWVKKVTSLKQKWILKCLKSILV